MTTRVLVYPYGMHVFLAEYSIRYHLKYTNAQDKISISSGPVTQCITQSIMHHVEHDADHDVPVPVSNLNHRKVIEKYKAEMARYLVK